MIELVIDQRRRNIGSFEVGRVLPFAKRRMVGPFIFFDHMGPVDLPRGWRVKPISFHIRISASPPSRICSPVKSSTATPLAWSRQSGRAR
jgi:hypothetical protein